MRICIACQVALPLAAFPYVPSKRYYRTRCRQCYNAYQLACYHAGADARAALAVKRPKRKPPPRPDARAGLAALVRAMDRGRR